MGVFNDDNDDNGMVCVYESHICIHLTLKQMAINLWSTSNPCGAENENFESFSQKNLNYGTFVAGLSCCWNRKINITRATNLNLRALYRNKIKQNLILSLSLWPIIFIKH